MQASEAKRRSEWDRTADQMALFATANWNKRFSREDFHPMRERQIADFQLDDPGAAYEQLIKEKGGKK